MPISPGVRIAATQASSAASPSPSPSAVIALRPSGCATAPRPVLVHTRPCTCSHTLLAREAALLSWARQPVIAITRALLIPPPSLCSLPLFLPTCRPSRIAVRGRSLPLHQASQSAHNPPPLPVSTVRGFNLDYYRTYLRCLSGVMFSSSQRPVCTTTPAFLLPRECLWSAAP